MLLRKYSMTYNGEGKYIRWWARSYTFDSRSRFPLPTTRFFTFRLFYTTPHHTTPSPVDSHCGVSRISPTLFYFYIPRRVPSIVSHSSDIVASTHFHWFFRHGRIHPYEFFSDRFCFPDKTREHFRTTPKQQTLKTLQSFRYATWYRTFRTRKLPQLRVWGLRLDSTTSRHANR